MYNVHKCRFDIQIMHSTVLRAYKRWIGEIITFLIKTCTRQWRIVYKVTPQEKRGLI